MSAHWHVEQIDPVGQKTEVHVYPQFPGEREHELHETCWCNPECEVDNERAKLLNHHRVLT